MLLVPQFDFQARACTELGSPLYATLLEAAARDIERVGPCAGIVAGYTEAPFGDAVPLRFMAGVHALVLSGAAPDLAVHYSGASGSASGDPRPAFLDTVAAHRDRIRDWLTRPLQTNEVGRAVPLLAGLLAAVDAIPLPVRLFELGSSAGLNLRADHVRWCAGELAWGPPDSPVTFDAAWRGPVPAWLTTAVRRHPAVPVLERRGCDPTPLDPRSPDDALTLRSYVWPDQIDRAARLDGALQLARQVPAEVTAIGAARFLADLDTAPGTLTVVWHSVVRQYVPAEEWAAVQAELDRLAAGSTPDAGFAYIAFEPEPTPGGFPLSLRLGAGPTTVLARAHPHGIPAYVPDHAAGYN